MKRLWILLLALCTVTLSCVGAVTLGAEEASTEVWSIYSLKEDANGMPYFATAPTYEYTEDGLKVTPVATMDSYTVQTDHAYYLDQGIYMEIKLDKPAVAGVLVFHIWDQNGMMVSNFNCGSGWEGMIQLDQSNSHYMMSAFIQGSTGPDDEGYAGILGSMKVNVPHADDGSVTYALYLKDGILRVNGSVVVGMDEALANLMEKRPDGSVYFGATVLMGEKGGLIPITVARFGTSPETAAVPGVGGELPETGEPSIETIAPGPIETDPPEDQETVPPAPGGDPGKPGGETDGETGDKTPNDDTPSETKPGESQSGDRPEEDTTDAFDSPYEETERETRKDIQNDKVDDFMNKLEGVTFGGCGAALGAGIPGLVSILAAAYVCARKKH